MWMSFMRAGDSQSAKQALDLVADDAYSSAGDMAYKKRVRLYKGVDSIETFMQNVSREDPLDTVTELYGRGELLYVHFAGSAEGDGTSGRNPCREGL